MQQANHRLNCPNSLPLTIAYNVFGVKAILREAHMTTATNQPAVAKSALKAGLYVVATPIGNLGDISRRAVETLAAADRILCEDTRISRRLLTAYGLDGNLIPYHDHNGAEMRPKVLQWLAAGEALVLISDAGTPLISDPGYKLVAEVAATGHQIWPVPGASALIAALSVAGLPTDRFTFAGFPPPKSQARQTWFAEFEGRRDTLVAYESGKRLAACLSDALKALGDRPAVVAREITKKFEEIRRDNLSDLSDFYKKSDTPKGEIVLLIGGADTSKDKASLSLSLEAFYADISPFMPVKAAADLAVKLYGGTRRDHYQALQALKGTN